MSVLKSHYASPIHKHNVTRVEANDVIHSVVESTVKLNVKNEWVSHFDNCGHRDLKP